MSTTKVRIVFVGLLLLATIILSILLITERGVFDKYDSLVENFIAELVGAVLIFGVIELVLYIRENNSRTRVAKIGLSELSICMNRLADVFGQIVKASSNDFSPNTFEQLFGDTTAELVSRRLDLAGPAPTMPRDTWRNYLAQEAGCMTDNLYSIQQLYQAYFSERTLECLADLRNNVLLNVFKALPQGEALDRQMGIQRPILNIPLDNLQPLLSRIGRTIMTVERDALRYRSQVSVRFPSHIFTRNDISPQRGSARFEGQPGPPFLIGAGPPPGHLSP